MCDANWISARTGKLCTGYHFVPSVHSPWVSPQLNYSWEHSRTITLELCCREGWLLLGDLLTKPFLTGSLGL